MKKLNTSGCTPLTHQEMKDISGGGLITNVAGVVVGAIVLVVGDIVNRVALILGILI